MPNIWDPHDPLAANTNHPYASSKRFIELLHCHLTSQPHVPLYFLTHPGITDSSIVAPYAPPWRDMIQVLKRPSFYFARALGSPWHSISGANGACATMWCV